MRKLITFAVFLFVLIAGCENKPSDALVKEQLKGFELFGDVKNYQRINGYKEGDYYVVEYSFDLYIDKEKIKKVSSQLKNDPVASMQYGLLLMGIGIRCGKESIEDGKPCRIEDKIKFIKGEKGWSVVEE